MPDIVGDQSFSTDGGALASATAPLDLNSPPLQTQGLQLLGLANEVANENGHANGKEPRNGASSKRTGKQPQGKR
jgi:hypothetical protein